MRVSYVWLEASLPMPPPVCDGTADLWMRWLRCECVILEFARGVHTRMPNLSSLEVGTMDSLMLIA